MKNLGRLIIVSFVVIISGVIIISSFCPIVQADDENRCNVSNNVTVKVKVLHDDDGNGGGGGGGGGLCPVFLKVDMFGNIFWVPVTYSGKTYQRFEKTKKSVTLEIAKNTICHDEDGRRLLELKITNCTETIPSSDKFLIIDSYCLTSRKDGANFSPSIDLTFSYDQKDIPDEVAEKDLFIGYYADKKWNRLASTVDTSGNAVITDIHHLTVFAVMVKIPVLIEKESLPELPPKSEPSSEAEPLTEAEPLPEPKAPPPSEKGFNWWLVGGIIIGVVIIIIGYYLIIYRRRDYL